MSCTKCGGRIVKSCVNCGNVFDVPKQEKYCSFISIIVNAIKNWFTVEVGPPQGG